MQRLEAKIDDPDMATLDGIAAELARHTRTVPNRTRALRWAIRGLSARLDLARKSKGAGAVFTAPGPMTPPPD